MECIKTGCHIWLEEYREWAYGDAFELAIDGGPGNLSYVYFFHLCARSHTPIRPVKHFTVGTIDHWFDDSRTSDDHNSTLVSRFVINHGYEGVPINA